MGFKMLQALHSAYHRTTPPFNSHRHLGRINQRAYDPRKIDLGRQNQKIGVSNAHESSALE
jgi:hypothetical protein